MSDSNRPKAVMYCNATSSRSGGGLVFFHAIGVALSARYDVDFVVLSSEVATGLPRLLPRSDVSLNIRVEEPYRSIRGITELHLGARDLRYDVVIVQSPYVPRLALNRRAYLLCEFPFSKNLAIDDRLRLSTYRRILTNSQYTRRWIEKRWGKDSDVIYPPVSGIRPGTKRPMILNVGRFVGQGRSKRQLELIGVFRKLVEAVGTGWELHLAGFVQDEAYARAVETQSLGLPVTVHFNIDRVTLEQLYSESTIYWHAVGEGIDPETHPEAMEHFGISTVEAMSAGAVPVVINRGGQTEIIGDSGAGVLWEDFDGCLQSTQRLIADEQDLLRRSRAARDRVAAFSLDQFQHRVDELFPGTAGLRSESREGCHS